MREESFAYLMSFFYEINFPQWSIFWIYQLSFRNKYLDAKTYEHVILKVTIYLQFKHFSNLNLILKAINPLLTSFY